MLHFGPVLHVTPALLQDPVPSRWLKQLWNRSCSLSARLFPPRLYSITGLYGRAAVPFGGTAVQPQAINRVGHNMSTNIKPAGLWEFEGSLVRCGWLVLSSLQDVDVLLPQYGRKMLELFV